MRVRLEQVWRFACPLCQHVNIVAGRKLTAEDLDDRTRAEAGEAFDMDPALMQPGDLVFEPTDVWCQKCESRFKAESPEG